jgi:hypothetical protein
VGTIFRAHLNKRFLTAILLGIGTIGILLFAFNSHPAVTEEDRIYLKLLMNKWGLEENSRTVQKSFEAEIAFISRIQDSVFQTIRGDGYPIPKDQVGRVRYYAEVGKGACYDRALLMEKIFSTYGFETRHAFLYFNRNETPIRKRDIFKKRLFTHALPEIKTSKGWMAVDTRDAWMGLDEKNNPLTIAELRNIWTSDKPYQFSAAGKNPTPLPTISLKGNFKIVYGLYSRHGGFIAQNALAKKLTDWGVPIPDYNLSQLKMNF